MEYKCRTCLVLLNTEDSNGRVHLLDDCNGSGGGCVAYDNEHINLREWISNSTTSNNNNDSFINNYQGQHENDLPQQICHECFEVARTAKEFRMKVIRAQATLKKELLAQQQDQQQQQLEEDHVACRICLKHYPLAIKSLTCYIKDILPQLKSWLDWTSGCCSDTSFSSSSLAVTSQLTDEWYTQGGVVCRFCISKLRECYEWHLTAEECAVYIKELLQQQYKQQQEQLLLASTTGWLHSATTEENFFPTDFFADVTTVTSSKQEQQQQYDFYDFNGAIFDGGTPTTAAEATGPYALNSSVVPEYQYNNNLMNYNATVAPIMDLYCNLCYTTFSNSILYENHDCTSKNVFSGSGGTPTATTLTRENNNDPYNYTNHEWDTNSSSGSVSATNSASGAAIGATPTLKLECSQCGKRFTKAILLEAHILKVHQGKKKPFQCRFCSHAYITHTHLKRHQKTAHKMEWLREGEGDSNGSGGGSTSQHNLLDL